MRHTTYHGCPNWTTGGCACIDLVGGSAGTWGGVERRKYADRRAQRAEGGALKGALAEAFCNMDENGDPVGAQPEPGWETGYAAGLRTAYRTLKAHGIPLPSQSMNDSP